MDKKMMENCTSMMNAMMKGGHSSGAGMGMMAASGGLLGRRFISRSILSRPLAVFSIGATVGALVYKNRAEIMKAFEPVVKEAVKTSARTGDAGKDFIQEQRERLSDIIAEVKEEEEEEAKQQAEESD